MTDNLPSTDDLAVAQARKRRDELSPEARAQATALIVRHLLAQSRQPFRELLTEMIGGAPTPEAIARFADKYPDRWAQAVSIMAGLSGYERGIVEINVFNIKGMSDSELMARLTEVEGQLAKALPARRPPVTIENASQHAPVAGDQLDRPADV